MLFQSMSNVKISMDNILIHASTKEELMQLTPEILTKLSKAGFKINPEECVFGA